jgi:hypothetical protein
MAVEAREPCDDCNNNNNTRNNNNNNKVILIKIISDFVFYDSISLNILKFTGNKF